MGASLVIPPRSRVDITSTVSFATGFVRPYAAQAPPKIYLVDNILVEMEGILEVYAAVAYNSAIIGGLPVPRGGNRIFTCNIGAVVNPKSRFDVTTGGTLTWIGDGATNLGPSVHASLDQIRYYVTGS